MRLVQIYPTDQDWQRMEEGVRRVNEHSAPHLRQSFETVRDTIKGGRAWWFVVLDGEEVLADLVLQILLADQIRELYIWLMHGEETAKWAKFAMSELKRIKPLMGCHRIKFQTSRPAWVRLLKEESEGWTHSHVFYLNDD